MSLIEIMVGMLVIGLVLAALTSVLTSSLRSIRAQEATTQATAAINDILEEAQRVDYDQAVLCDSTATTAFGGTTFDSEDLVLNSEVCGTADEVLPERTVTRDGRDYTVTTAITWADDPGDGTGASDDDTTQDIKRVVVEVGWTVNGQARTARNMAFRAAELDEQLIEVAVTPDDGSEFVVINDDATDDGENDEAFTLQARGRVDLTKVEVEWIDRNGDVESRTMTEVDADDNVWEYSLHSNFGPFANGATLFEFTATSTTGDTETVTARGLFLYDPPVMLVGDSGDTVQRNFASRTVRVGPDGAVCPDQRLWVDVEGVVRSDVAEAIWLKGPDPALPDPLDSVDAPDDVAKRGARFELDLSGRTDFATYDSSTDTYELADPNQVRVSVERIVDEATIDKELDNIRFSQVEAC